MEQEEGSESPLADRAQRDCVTWYSELVPHIFGKNQFGPSDANLNLTNPCSDALVMTDNLHCDNNREKRKRPAMPY